MLALLRLFVCWVVSVLASYAVSLFACSRRTTSSVVGARGDCSVLACLDVCDKRAAARACVLAWLVVRTRRECAWNK